MEKKFSKELKKQIEELDINYSQLSKQTGIERSLLYKIVSGQRKPKDRKMVEKILDTMMITNSYKEKMLDLYQISKFGEKGYIRNKNVKGLLEEFSDSIEYEEDNVNLNYSCEIQGIQDYIAINREDELFWTIRAIVYDALAKDIDEINIVMQTDNEFFMKLFYFIEKIDSDVKINHIVCLEKNIKNNDTNTYNINTIKNMVPFLLNRKNYDFYVYYDDISAKFNKTALFPYMIFINDTVVTLSSDFDYGFVFRNNETYSIYKKFYDNIKSVTLPLVTRFNNIMEMSMYYYDKEKNNRFVKYDLMDQPCMVWFLDEKMVKKYVKPEINQELIEKTFDLFKIRAEKYFKYLKEGNTSKIFFSLAGLERFINEGIIDEIDSGIYNPFEKCDVLIMLKRMLEFFKTSKYDGGILNKETFKINSNLILAAFEGNEINIIFNNNDKETVFFTINEKSISNSICQFLEFLNQSDYIREDINVTEYLEKRILELECEIS